MNAIPIEKLAEVPAVVQLLGTTVSNNDAYIAALRAEMLGRPGAAAGALAPVLGGRMELPVDGGGSFH
jgi:hypothetical protein